MQLKIIVILLGLATPAIAADRPNVIIIMTDDQGYGDLACHGNPILKTPNLDQLAAESIRLTDFHVSPFCTPTRAALMTGRDPARTGAYRTSSGRTMLHTDERTIANVFTDAGYVTGMIGKWHLGDNVPHRPQDRGFQDVVWHRCGGVGQASDYWGNDYFDDTYERNGKFEKFHGYCTDVWFREAHRFIKQNKEKPFLLYVATNAPHGPYRVDPKWSDPYKEAVPWAGNGPNFFGMIANIDHNVGILREQLKKYGLAENTILVFMTDNGTAAGAKFKGLDSEPTQGFNAGMRGKKSSPYEGGHRVPFFIHWPQGGLNGGRDLTSLTAHLDVLPTLAELCGVKVPDSHRPDGISFAPQLKSPDAELKRSHLVVQFYGGPRFTGPASPYSHSCVIRDKWRLMNGRELYDIAKDPAQREDIAAANPKVVAELRALYMPHWKSVAPRMTPVAIDLGNPAQNPTELSSQDWYIPKGNPPWNFGLINKLPRVVGPWNVNVRQAGRYRITLRQYPEVADKPVVAVRAKIEIAGKTMEQPVEAGSKGVEFEIDLPVGPTQLVTYLYNEKGKAGGAYFTEVELLSDSTATAIPGKKSEFQGFDSDQLKTVSGDKFEEELYLDRKQAFANPKNDNPELPNVLLIGDSISIGYTAYVRRQLKDQADVYCIPTNAKNSAYGLKHLDQWLTETSISWDVVHFNWGLWDLCYRHPESKVQGNRDKINGTLTESLEGYQANMNKIVARLRQTDATLIWCTTTPVPKGEAGRKLGDDIKYNQVAADIMRANNVLINDLHSHALLNLPETMVRDGDVHFTERGYIRLAEKVAAEISSVLAKQHAQQ